MGGDHSDVLHCGGVFVTGEGITEGTPTRQLVMVPRGAIRGLSACRGFRARHPLLLAAFGIAVLVAVLIPLSHLPGWLNRGGTIADVEVLALGLIPIGGWAVYEAAQRAYLLYVDADDGHDRFEFDAKVDGTTLEEFLTEVERELDCPVERSGLNRGVESPEKPK